MKNLRLAVVAALALLCFVGSATASEPADPTAVSQSGLPEPDWVTIQPVQLPDLDLVLFLMGNNGFDVDTAKVASIDGPGDTFVVVARNLSAASQPAQERWLMQLRTFLADKHKDAMAAEWGARERSGSNGDPCGPGGGTGGDGGDIL